jgi:hypothetical protein
MCCNILRELGVWAQTDVSGRSVLKSKAQATVRDAAGHIVPTGSLRDELYVLKVYCKKRYRKGTVSE